MPKQTNPETQTQTKTTNRKTPSKLSETLRFQKDKILGALSTSSRRHSDSRTQVERCPKLLIAERSGSPAYIPVVEQG